MKIILFNFLYSRLDPQDRSILHITVQNKGSTKFLPKIQNLQTGWHLIFRDGTVLKTTWRIHHWPGMWDLYFAVCFVSSDEDYPIGRSE